MLANHVFWRLMLFYTHLLQPLIMMQIHHQSEFFLIWCITNLTPTSQVTPPWNVYMANLLPAERVTLADCDTHLGGSPHISCKCDQIKMSDYMDRQITPPKRVSSPTWGPPLPCKQALSQKFWLVFQSFYCCLFLFELINIDSKKSAE